MSLTGSMKSDYKLVGTLTGLDFIRGYSAFEVAVINGFSGTEEDWLHSLHGKDAYEIAVENGFDGNETAWLASLKGDKGDKGEAGTSFKLLGFYPSVSALMMAVPNPQTGDVYGVGASEPYDIYIYNASDGWVNNGKLQGAKGEKGDKGDKGDTGEPGKDGKDGEPGTPGKDGQDGAPGAKGDKGDKGEPGANGANGTDGKDGADGHTPIKGVDYFTQSEINEIVNRVVIEVGGSISNVPTAMGVGF
jgi:hypothetical protein